MSNQDIREQIRKLTEANEAAAKVAVEEAQLKQQLRLAQDSTYQAYCRDLAIQSNTNKVIEGLISQVSSVIEQAGLSFRVGYKNGLGDTVNYIYQLVSGIQYSATSQEVRDQVLAMTGLNQENLNSLLRAFGNTPYFSTEAQGIVEATDYSSEEAVHAISNIAEKLNIVVDTASITDAAFEAINAKALKKAHQEMQNAQEALKALAIEGEAFPV